jgi:hypothetical protein
MRRATTPLHKFTFPISPETFEKILITYSQGRKIILEKERDDLTISGNTVSFQMSQEEANLFKTGDDVRVQVRALTYAGNAVASKVITISVGEVLNDVILQRD